MNNSASDPDRADAVSDIRDRYQRRAQAFENLITAVAAHHWSAPSPCAEWDARDLVAHVIDMHNAVLAPLDRSVPALAEDPLTSFRTARAAIEDVLANDSAASTMCDTPAGHVTAAENIDGVISDDLVLHGWDLARATNQDDTIDPEDLRRLGESLAAIPAELMDKYRTPGAFGPGIIVYGPEVDVDDNAPLQHRLLGAIGRHPNWTPNTPC